MPTIGNTLKQLQKNKPAVVDYIQSNPITVEEFCYICTTFPDNLEMDGLLLDNVGDRLWEAAQNPLWWSTLGGQKNEPTYGITVDIDARIIGASTDDRWFEYFRFRWEQVDGQPFHMIGNDVELNSVAFFSYGWNSALKNNNIFILRKMLEEPQWRSNIRSGLFKIYPSLEDSSIEACNLLIDSNLFRFEDVLNLILVRYDPKNLLKHLLDDPRSTSEVVAHMYLKSLDYVEIFNLERNSMLASFLTHVQINSEDIDGLHHNIIKRCFTEFRRDAPHNNIALFVDGLRSAPFVDESVLVHKMLENIKQMDDRTAWGGVLERLIEELPEKKWCELVEQWKDHPFLTPLPRWQKDVLMAQLDDTTQLFVSKKI